MVPRCEKISMKRGEELSKKGNTVICSSTPMAQGLKLVRLTPSWELSSDVVVQGAPPRTVVVGNEIEAPLPTREGHSTGC